MSVRGVVAGDVGHQPVLVEAGAHILARRLENDIHAPAQIAGDVASVAFLGADHLDLALVVQLAALGPGPHHMRQVLDPAGREGEAVGRGCQPRGVGDGGHLDRRLGAVEERVEHLGVHAGVFRLRGGEAVMVPDRIRRGRVIGGQELGAFAGGHDVEQCCVRCVWYGLLKACDTQAVAVPEVAAVQSRTAGDDFQQG